MILQAAASIGDVLDRITILQIKRERITDAAKRANVAREHAELCANWGAAGLPEPLSVPEYADLLAVNTALWEVEDRLRAMEARGDFGPAFVEDARAVYRTNDRRAALKRAVNQRFGSALVEEKQHPGYHAPAEAPVPEPVAPEPPAPEPPRPDLTHLTPQGDARMVDVGEKAVTRREAVAAARVRLSADAFAQVQARAAKKGDVLTVAQVAGIMATRRTSDLIPLCHPIPIDGVDLTLDPAPDPAGGGWIEIRCAARCTGRTGIEMEALTGAAVAALTVYDMLKAVERGIEISGLRLISKSGGRSGTWSA